MFKETDLILMALVIFLPALFALPLCVRWIFPRGSEEWMKWWALLGTAITLVVSLCIFSDYLGMIDRTSDPSGVPGRSKGSTLERRVETEISKAAATGPRDSKDLVARYSWIDTSKFRIDFYLGLDGISMPLVLLTTALSFLAMIASWNIEKNIRGYLILFLLLETGMVGTFMALDFFVFFIFWEVMLLPMYFLIGVWGGPRREYAAMKFFLYTMLGSVFILIAMIAFYFTDLRDIALEPTDEPAKLAELDKTSAQPRNSFDMVVLHKAGRAAFEIIQFKQEYQKLPDEKSKSEALEKANNPWALARKEHLADPNNEAAKQRFERLDKQWFFTPAFQYTMFILLLVGFAIKVPVFPFHTWLPDAHVEAPTPISMILAGILLKMGGYGIIRIAYPICPWAAESLGWYVALFGVINIVYGAFAAMAQTDFKKLVAYSSISHMGYVILGISVWKVSEGSQFWEMGMLGAMYQMIAHGITSAGMFFLVGVIYDRAHHRNLNNFRGLAEPMPLYSGVSAIIFFAAMGLPGMCGFVGEVMVILATWNYDRVFAILAALTVVLTAGYILWTVQRVFLGVNLAYKDYADISFRELICVVPLVVFAFLLGVWPNLLMYWMQGSVTGLVETLAQLSK